MRQFVRIRRGMAAVAFMLCGTSAFAQATIGELLDAGGKQLGKAELVVLLSGASYTGVTRFGVRFTVHGKADGSYTGVSGPENKPFSGRWWVEDGGLYCTEVGGGRHGGESSCTTWFRKGTRYFASDADAARSAPLRKRELQQARRAAPASPHGSKPAVAMRQSTP